MSLIKSVSGMRGTIGGRPGESLTPVDIVEFAAAYSEWLKGSDVRPKVVIGRDGRITGEHVQSLVTETLRASGVDVIDLGLSTTPTVEMYVKKSTAQGGIIITASHNPMEWNALKFLNAEGEFISAEDGESLLEMASSRSFRFVPLDAFGKYHRAEDALAHHVDAICDLDLVDVEAIRGRNYHIIADCVNSTGALAIPALLERLGCTYDLLNADISGHFAHNPEPLPENLGELMQRTAEAGADLGIAVDPDVDRLAFVCENGSYFGEEYTLVAIADYVLSRTPGNTVSNMSSTQALRDVTAMHGGSYSASPVGEVHVVRQMKETGAVIGGEGNGGVIYPALHYGRDALVGLALMLSFMATTGRSATAIRAGYPDYHILKTRIGRDDAMDFDQLGKAFGQEFAGAAIDTRDGIKVSLPSSWIQMRKSNTEPIIRIYAEAPTEAEAQQLVDRVQRVLALGKQ